MPDSRDLFKPATDFVKLGQLDEVFAIFQTLLKTDSNNAIVWNHIGIIRFRRASTGRRCMRSVRQPISTRSPLVHSSAKVWHSFISGKIPRHCVRPVRFSC